MGVIHSAAQKKTQGEEIKNKVRLCVIVEICYLCMREAASALSGTALFSVSRKEIPYTYIYKVFAPLPPSSVCITPFS